MRGVVAVTCSTLALGGLAGVGIAGRADAAEPAPVVSLTRASATQTITRYGDDTIDLSRLAVYLVAGDAPVEFRSTISRYDQPVTTTLTTGKGAGLTTRTLAPGLTTDVNQLTDMFAVTLKNAAGQKVFSAKTSFCPGYGSTRQRPDAPATSPYPMYCGIHPFARGAVFGIQQGWSVRALSDPYGFYGGGEVLPPVYQGKDGTYTATVSLTAAYRTALGLTAEQARTSVTLKVRTVKLTESRSALRPEGTPLSPAARRPGVTAGAAARAIDAGTVPDLRSLPAYGMSLNSKMVRENGKRVRRTYLAFGATVWNAGPSPLLVDGFRRPGEELMDAYQYFYDTAGNEVGSQSAGTLEYDRRKGHEHWHFTDFAVYELLNSDRTKTWRSGKEAFCLAPTDPVDLTKPGALWKPESTGLETACGSEEAISIREALPAGWGDTYSQDRPGQAFNISKVPNGLYYIRVTANPEGKLVEASTANNVATRRVKIGGAPNKKRTLKVLSYQGKNVP